MLRFIVLGSLVTCLLTTIAVADEISQTELELHPIELKIIAKTNEKRASHGLKPLVTSSELVASARKHTSWMCRTRNLVHTTKAVGENIAMGQRSADEAVRDWMNSSGHRANILNPRYTRIGVAAYQIGDEGTVYWCQQFLP